MKYSVKNLRKKPEGWYCTLEWWEGCYCSKESKEVFIPQEKKPTLAEIKAI